MLVDVARQLFAKKGLENTTMNDIAQASGKGRRTLYTYFKSKDDIYYAVIETELERLSDKLDEVAARKISPQEKVIELIYTHLSMIRETVVRNGNLRAEFFRNIWMVEKVRKHFDLAEVEPRASKYLIYMGASRTACARRTPSRRWPSSSTAPWESIKYNSIIRNGTFTR